MALITDWTTELLDTATDLLRGPPRPLLFLGTTVILDTIDYLKRCLEGAPANPGKLAPNLRGWRTPDGVYVCIQCAGRIMARGCNLPRDSEPNWRNDAAPALPCCCCGT